MNFPSGLVEHLFREQSGKMYAVLIHQFGVGQSDFVEDVIQETFIAALKTWRMKGVPEKPEAWLMRVAKNKLLNLLKRERRLVRFAEFEKAGDWQVEMESVFLPHEIKDAQLRALCMCCRPELSLKNQIMLMLKILSGFGNAEIAAALCMSEVAVRKAIYRAKDTLVQQKSKKELLGQVHHQESIGAVVTVLYLMFNEGYRKSTGKEVLDIELCAEAMRLGFLLLDMELTNKGEIHALLSLMFFSTARFPARIHKSGRVISIEEQDRSLWNQQYIKRGLYHLEQSRSSDQLTVYHLEASIASVHCTAKNLNNTKWVDIVAYYELLQKMSDSEMIRINLAIAKSEWKGAETGLLELRRLEESGIQKSQLFCAAMAHIYRKLNHAELAKSYYQVAIDLSTIPSEKKYLEYQLNELLKKSFVTN